MRKKDYQLIASLLSQYGYVKKHREDWVALCQLFASGLEATSPKFNRRKFLTACGIEHDYEAARQAFKDSED